MDGVFEWDSYNISMALVLRIAVYALFGLLVFVLSATWFLSCIAGVAIVKTERTGTQTRFGVDDGYVYMNRAYIPGLPTHNWRLEEVELYPKKFEWVSGYSNRKIMVPIWAVLVVLTGIAYARFRFSLRRLMIAAAILAAVFGVIRFVIT
jgi:hypothetical protein